MKTNKSLLQIDNYGKHWYDTEITTVKLKDNSNIKGNSVVVPSKVDKSKLCIKVNCITIL